MADKQYDNTNRGTLFKNHKKESEKHPDYKGEINVDGAEFWLAAWLKTAKNGEKFFSFAVTAKDADKAKKPAAAEMKDLDSDLPF
jgi:uncharacterized protein (DUF736 family)